MNSTIPRDTAAFEVREALVLSGCPVCHLAVRSVGRLIQSVAYEQVNDPGLRKDLREARGFCNQHAYRWLHEARSVLGTALIYRDVLTATLRAFEGTAVANGQRSGLLRALLGSEDSGAVRGGLCPACHTQREAEDRYLEALLASLTVDEETRLAFDASHGLCYHRHAVAAVRRGGPAAERVVEQTRRATQALIGSLDEVIRKEDYRFLDEPRSEDERVAPASAIAWAAGIEGLVEV
jgi:hypothetical protein